MRVLITGGSGFIGRYLTEQLVAAGYSCTILDLVPPNWSANGTRFVEGDVRATERVHAALEGCDTVFHLAAAHHDFGIARETYFSVNEHGSSVVCQAMDDAGVRRACFFSSVAVYGQIPEPRREDSPANPVSPYGQSKLAGEAVFRRWAEQGGARSVLIIRPAMTFGPRNFANMYSLIRQIHSGLFVPVGSGANVKSLSYVENVVDATLALWRRRDLPASDAYNVIDKPDLTSRQIADTIYEALGKTPPGFRIPLPVAMLLGRPFDLAIALTGKNLPISTARIGKLAAVQTKFEGDKLRSTGLAPRVPLTDGIRRMVEWFKREGRTQKPVWHVPSAQVGGPLRTTHSSAGGE